MKTIKINHIAKTEGHMSFIGSLVNADFAQARIETEEGARLIEGIILGRKYYEAPIVTSRICGICPIVHNLTSIKAMEDAFDVKVTKEITLLRKMMINAQWIHSHALHAFFLSFPDIVGISNNFDFLKKYPEESKLALSVRDWGVRLAKVLGGRTVHPINSVIGGFNVEPDWQELSDLMLQQNDILKQAIKLFDFVKAYKMPQFERETQYLSLQDSSEYSIYDGKIATLGQKKTVSIDKFADEMEELILPHEKVKRVRRNEEEFFVGALARINNSFDQLNPWAKKAWKRFNVKLPSYNSFNNISAQVVEIIHNIEEVGKIFGEYKTLRAKPSFSKNLKVDFKPKAGRGRAVMEAPRGILYHEYEVDAKGEICNCNIITPTAMFLANMEKDLEKYIPTLKNLTPAKRELLIKTLIRAYDPCISCATH